MKPVAIALLGFLFCHNAVSAHSEQVKKARESLKNYGLVNCIASQFTESSAIGADLAATSGAYHFMGKGMHIIVQDEGSLITRHDPYQATKVFVAVAYGASHNISKLSTKKLVFHRCLKIFNSPEYDRFIASQDRYIERNQ